MSNFSIFPFYFKLINFNYYAVWSIHQRILDQPLRSNILLLTFFGSVVSHKIYGVAIEPLTYGIVPMVSPGVR